MQSKLHTNTAFENVRVYPRVPKRKGTHHFVPPHRCPDPEVIVLRLEDNPMVVL